MIQNLVTWAALVMGICSFALFVLLTIATTFGKRAAGGPEPKELGIDGVTKLAEALTKLTEALTRAGPALTALIASFVFFMIATLSSNALHV